MRIYVAVILLVSVCSMGLAQQPGCCIPVSITVHDLSSLPIATAEAMVNEWERNVRAKKYELPYGGWNWNQQSWDFQNALIARETWDILKRPSARALQDSIFSGDLPTEAFVARDENGPIHVLSASSDCGPRRIIFVAETAKRMPTPARKIEAAVISHIVSTARPEDSFALITARGPRVELRFGSSREAIRAAADQLESPPQDKPAKGGVLDAVLEATTWLQPPEVGDSILVMTMGLEKKHKASFSNVRAAVAAGGTRVFALQLGLYSIESQSGGVDRGVPHYPDSSLQNEVIGLHAVFDQTRALAEGSGGIWVLENTEEGKDYKLTDDRLKGLQVGGEMIYRRMRECYIPKLGSAGPHLVIGLTEPFLEQLPWVRLHYPEYLPPCAATSTPCAP